MAYIDRTKLLTDIDNGIKAGNLEEGYEQYQNINNMDDIIEAIEWSDEADVIERSKVDEAIEDMERYSVAADYEGEKEISKAIDKCVEILKRNIGE